MTCNPFDFMTNTEAWFQYYWDTQYYGVSHASAMANSIFDRDSRWRRLCPRGGGWVLLYKENK